MSTRPQILKIQDFQKSDLNSPVVKYENLDFKNPKPF